MRHLRRFFSVIAALVLWVGALGLYYRPDLRPVVDHHQVSPTAEALANRQLSALNSPALRATNPEWDFMTRSFVEWSLVNLALRDPSWKPKATKAIDELLRVTLAEEAERGGSYFLMSYGRGFEKSLFIDSELALSLGLRRLLGDDEGLRARFRERVRHLEARFAENPLPPSYPDEAWTFDSRRARRAAGV